MHTHQSYSDNDTASILSGLFIFSFADLCDTQVIKATRSHLEVSMIPIYTTCCFEGAMPFNDVFCY